ncbi:MAG: type II toxin-antitoxin system HicA family toxin [Armatimonadetes bacterium]|nr:type II toxin-antitoxin system HicA family toxin [Armatimonadota bacterium]NOG92438.1 type II toxin-antitoxin system HicA family toxin [Armatimonadota bacterium]
MNKRDLVRHLRDNGCELLRQGKHEIWFNPRNRQSSPVPRHNTIDRFLVRKICRELGIVRPKGT